VDIISTLEGYNAVVDVYDPWVCPIEAHEEYGIEPIAALEPGTYDAVGLAVAHREFAALGPEGVRALAKPQAVVYDVKHVLPKLAVDGRL
jgi:UDP-N-acetyl-D-galactosamine dehydrogenase